MDCPDQDCCHCNRMIGMTELCQVLERHKSTIHRAWKSWGLPVIKNERGYIEVRVRDLLRWEKPPVMHRITKGWILPEDGILDEVAIEIAIRGQRPVRLTLRERRAVVKSLIDRGASPGEIIEKLRTNPKWVTRTLHELGYDVLGTGGNHGTYIVPKNRPKSAGYEGTQLDYRKLIQLHND